MHMQVSVTFRPRRQPDRVVDLPAGATVADLLEATGQQRDHVLVVRGRDPIPEDEAVRDGEQLLVLSAFSGG
jgi:sulfur carrier protein ThiS